MRSIFVLMAVLVSAASGQFYYHTNNGLTGGYANAGYAQQPIVASGVSYDPTAPNPRGLAHRAVVENAAVEAQLPQELINPFYKNPRIAAGLAKESWFGDKEFPVFNRQADKIPREEISKIIRRIEHKSR